MKAEQQYGEPEKRFYSPFRTFMDVLLPFDMIVTVTKDHLPFLMNEKERAERFGKARRRGRPAVKQQLSK